MRKIVLLFLMLLFVIGLGAFAQKNSNTWLMSGDTLVYNINNYGNQYDFIITNLQIENNIAFDWLMTNQDQLKGSIVMSRYALDTATFLKNYFNDGESVLTDKTTVWASTKVYNAIKKKKPVSVNAGNGNAILEFKEKKEFTFSLNDQPKTVKVLYAETKSAEKFWILDDPKNPLILKMDLGWTVTLTKVEN